MQESAGIPRFYCNAGALSFGGHWTYENRFCATITAGRHSTQLKITSASLQITLSNFRQLASMIANVAGFNPEVRGQSDKPEGVFARNGDTAKQKSLGFNYTIDLEEGIRWALDYLRNTAS